MFNREYWQPNPKNNYIAFDNDNPDKRTVALAIENGVFLVVVYVGGGKWEIIAKNPLGANNLFKLKHLVETETNCVGLSQKEDK